MFLRFFEFNSVTGLGFLDFTLGLRIRLRQRQDPCLMMFGGIVSFFQFLCVFRGKLSRKC